MVGITVGQHDEVAAARDGLVDFGKDLLKALAQRLAAAGHLIQALDDERTVVSAEHLGLVEPLELRHLVGVDDGQRDQDLLGVQLGILQQVRLGADGGFERGDDLLALPVQRRVGDLRELLVEVVEQHAAALGEHRQRVVVAHRAQRLLAGVGHRREQHLEVFLGVAERALTTLHGLAGMAHVLAVRQVAHLHGVAFDPLTVRVLRGKVPLDLLVGDDAALVGVDKEHLSGLQTALGDNMLVIDLRQHAGFGGEHKVAVIGELPAAGAELVERAHVGVELVVVLPCRRQHHRDGVRQGAAGEVQQFEAFVERAGIRIAGRGDRQQRLELAEQFGAQAAFAG